ncbi:MAG: HD domain-containing protein [bacterium]|nr:HD domain-containing protein [bacterium]
MRKIKKWLKVQKKRKQRAKGSEKNEGQEKRREEQERRLRKLLRQYGADILKSDNFLKSEHYIQHGNVSVMRHSISVAKHSLLIAKHLGIRCNKRDLIRGALLHDYFLYDWHSEEHSGLRNLHGFYHPGIALKNAKKEYHLNRRQSDIIKKHMWPLTVVPPRFREAWIVTMADKYCSLMETLHLHRGGKRRHKRRAHV